METGLALLAGLGLGFFIGLEYLRRHQSNPENIELKPPIKVDNVRGATDSGSIVDINDNKKKEVDEH